MATGNRSVSAAVIAALTATILAACSSGPPDEAGERSERLTVPPDLSDERLGSVPERQTASGREVQGLDEDQIELQIEDRDEPRLLVKTGYLETWQRVGLALERAGFNVEDRDRAGGEYRVRYDPSAGDSDDDEGGFWSWLAFWRSSEPTLEPGTYALLVRTPEPGTTVTVRDTDNEPVDPALAEQLLELIREQMR